MAASPGPLPPPPNLRLMFIIGVAIAILAVAALWPKGGAPSGYYATKLVAFDQGRIQQSGCPTWDPKDVLGPPDNKFVPLGVGGRMVVQLPIPARDVRDVTLYVATGPTLLLPSRAWTPVPVQQVGNQTLYAIEITASPAWPLGGTKFAYVSFDPDSRTPDGFTRAVVTDRSQEPVKCTSGMDIDAVQVAPLPGAP